METGLMPMLSTFGPCRIGVLRQQEGILYSHLKRVPPRKNNKLPRVPPYCGKKGNQGRKSQMATTQLLL